MAELDESYFSLAEIRSDDERAYFISQFLPKVIKTAKNDTLGYKETFSQVEPTEITSLSDLKKIPVLRKSD